MHYNCVRHTKSIYPLSLKFKVNTVTNIEVIRQNAFRHARVMVTGVSSDLKKGTVSIFAQYICIIRTVDSCQLEVDGSSI